jgi:hypothetical protein
MGEMINALKVVDGYPERKRLLCRLCRMDSTGSGQGLVNTVMNLRDL